MHYYPSDPLFEAQWHLDNTGEFFGTAGMDIRATEAWFDYSGAGVLIAIVDDGVRYTHPDIAPVYDAEHDYNSVTGSDDASPIADAYSHGTAVGGFASAALDGGLGVGVAWGSSLTGVRISNDADSLVAPSVGLAAATDADITNNSYGNAFFLPITVPEAAENLARDGRDGLGTLNVFAMGNDRTETIQGLTYPSANSPFQVAVAATDSDGQIAVFSTPGANVFIAAPGDEVYGVSGRDDGYANEIGTSFAAPIVSGVAALILEANPALGYRDIKDILAYSAYDTGASPLHEIELENGFFRLLGEEMNSEENRPVVDAAIDHILAYPWVEQANGAEDWNGGGLTVSQDFGFGQVDAAAAVRLAETWTSVARTHANLDIQTISGGSAQPLPSGGSATVVETFEVTMDMRVEEAVVSLDISNGFVGNLQIALTSPTGTVSYLSHTIDYEIYFHFRPDQGERASDSDGGLDIDSATFLSSDEADLMTTQSYGESALGTWTLEITDMSSEGGAVLESSSLSLYGGETTVDDRYIYTDQYVDLAAADTTRSVLSDTDGGTDQINAAALTVDAVIRLDGEVGSIGTADFSLATGTVIETAYTGDGDDTLVGSDGADSLFGGRGEDFLFGGDGDDYLDGGRGTDIARYTGLSSDYTLSVLPDGTVQVVYGSETDILSNIEIVAFDDGNRLVDTVDGTDIAGFDAETYLESNPDVARSGYDQTTAYNHYLDSGGLEGRDPNMLFDGNAYLDENPDVREQGVNPFLHYTTFGHQEGRDPSRWFDADAYLADNPDVAASGLNPVIHYLFYGTDEGRMFQFNADYLI